MRKRAFLLIAVLAMAGTLCACERQSTGVMKTTDGKEQTVSEKEKVIDNNVEQIVGNTNENMETESVRSNKENAKGELTNILDEKVQDFEYIIDSKYLSIASFSLVSCVLLAIKEDVVEGTKENYGTKIFYDELLSSVDMIATKKSDGFYIDNHKFKDAASVVGELRNKIAHGSFKLNAELSNSS